MVSMVLEYVRARYFGEKGQGIVEYAVLLAFVVAVAAVVGSNGTLTTKVKAVFNDVTNTIQ